MTKAGHRSAAGQHRFRVADLPARRGLDFSLTPDSAHREEIAQRLGLQGLRKLSFNGSLHPEGKRDWLLTADLGATVVQSCVVTLAPVVTRIDEAVSRRYSADFQDIVGATGSEDRDTSERRAQDTGPKAGRDKGRDRSNDRDDDIVEAGAMMFEDETIDPLPQVIDVAEVMEETLALCLPLYPRAGDAEMSEAVFTEPGRDALRDEDVKPFAGLSALRDQLAHAADGGVGDPDASDATDASAAQQGTNSKETTGKKSGAKDQDDGDGSDRA